MSNGYPLGTYLKVTIKEITNHGVYVVLPNKEEGIIRNEEVYQKDGSITEETLPFKSFLFVKVISVQEICSNVHHYELSSRQAAHYFRKVKEKEKMSPFNSRLSGKAFPDFTILANHLDLWIEEEYSKIITKEAISHD